MLVIEQTVRQMKFPVKLLNITGLSSYRSDGHPSIYGLTNAHGYQDCSHWCLPGIPDVWNVLLYALLIMDPKTWVESGVHLLIASAGRLEEHIGSFNHTRSLCFAGVELNADPLIIGWSQRGKWKLRMYILKPRSSSKENLKWRWMDMPPSKPICTKSRLPFLHAVLLDDIYLVIQFYWTTYI